MKVIDNLVSRTKVYRQLQALNAKQFDMINAAAEENKQLKEKNDLLSSTMTAMLANPHITYSDQKDGSRGRVTITESEREKSANSFVLKHKDNFPHKSTTWYVAEGKK